MSELRPYCLSIAGFDPSAGAGVLADIKTFETLRCYGLGVVSAVTSQNDEEFIEVKWQSLEQIKSQLMPLAKFPVKSVKIGLVDSFEMLKGIVDIVQSIFNKVFIVWDPVLKASAGFSFIDEALSTKDKLLGLDLITPNFNEYEQMNLNGLTHSPCAILLKGGHRKEKYATDTLFLHDEAIDIAGEPFENKIDKHGTGCVLSSAIAAYVALGNNQPEACRLAKQYTEKLILSNSTRLGYHMP